MKKIVLLIAALFLMSAMAPATTINGLTGMSVLPDANIMEENSLEITASYINYSYDSQITGALSYAPAEKLELAISATTGDKNNVTAAAKYQLPLTIPAKAAVGASYTTNTDNNDIYGVFVAVTLPVFEPIPVIGGPGLDFTIGTQYNSNALVNISDSSSKNYFHFYAGSTLTYGRLDVSVDVRLRISSVDHNDMFAFKAAYTLPDNRTTAFVGINNGNLYNTASKTNFLGGLSYRLF